MGAFVGWLLREEQKELFQSLYAAALCVVFFGLAALALWPLGAAAAVWGMFKGYWVLCIVLPLTILLLSLFHRVLRINYDDNFNAYVISALVVSGFALGGYSAFAALTAREFAAAASYPLAAALYAVGFLSCYVSLAVVAVYYRGQIYTLVHLILAGAVFILCAVWPAAARFVYGWFFDLF